MLMSLSNRPAHNSEEENTTVQLKLPLGKGRSERLSDKPADSLGQLLGLEADLPVEVGNSVGGGSVRHHYPLVTLFFHFFYPFYFWPLLLIYPIHMHQLKRASKSWQPQFMLRHHLGMYRAFLLCGNYKLLSYADVVRSVSFHEDEPILLSGSDDCTVKLWNWRAAGTVGYAKYARYHRLIRFFHFSRFLTWPQLH